VEKRLNHDLLLLGMPNARFRLQTKKSDELSAFGVDLISFDFSANKGASFKPVEKVASGGELSRIMLIIKSYLAEKTTLPTLIFDEIDTGVSGEIARKVAELMKALSGKHQLITITHLPQIAARGDAHYHVFKYDENGKTTTGIRNLEEEDRIAEIARLLSGDNPTSGALTNARELMDS
jgi:DNA repair protein RecN (Recombination protein N)